MAKSNVSPIRLFVTTGIAIFFGICLIAIWIPRHFNDLDSPYERYVSYPQQVVNWYALAYRTKNQEFPNTLETLLDEAREKPQNDQLSTLLKLLIKVPYNVTSTHQTPFELMSNAEGGDCNDFAYAWYVMLKRLDLPAEILYISVYIEGSRYLHAVTLTENAAGEKVVLDINEPFSPRAYAEWKEAYQVNLLYKASEQGLEML